MTFFKASETLTGDSTDPTMGWRDWVSGVEVHIVPGNHANMMYQPHVAALARRLAECLNQAQSGETGAAGKIDR
jgi:thioesterase domain-containing protein